MNKICISSDLRIPPLSHINDIDSLKAIGAYREVKLGIDKTIGLPLRANGWVQMFNKIKEISTCINRNYDFITRILEEEEYIKEIGCFSEVKKKVSNIFSFQIKASSWKGLKLKLSMIFKAFNGCDSTNRHELFEKNKIRNFISSSKLEGIQISENLVSRSMEEVLKKYRFR